MLRDYQQKAVELSKAMFNQGHRRLILCSPTGSGKTFIFSYLTYLSIEKGNKVLIITDREELLDQSSSTLSNFNIFPVKIKPGVKVNLNYNVFVGMAQTLKRRIEKPEYRNWIKGINLIIIDEAHKREADFVFPYLSRDQFLLGPTATPVRMGKETPLIEFYDGLLEVEKISNLIKAGYLLPAKHYEVKGVDTSTLRVSGGEYSQKTVSEAFGKNVACESVYNNYMRICPGKKFLCFCVSIDNAKEVAKHLTEKGLKISVVDSKNTTNSERKKALRDLKEGNITGIVNVGVLTTGFDEPSLEVVILYRATKSLSLYLQMIGRGSRLSPETGKKFFYILDFGGNVQRFGLYHENRLWQLESPKKNKDEEGLIPLKCCPVCDYMMHTSVRLCPDCGFEFVRSEDEKLEVYLEEVPYEEIILKPVETTPEIDLMEKIRVKLDYKNGWILNRFRRREQFVKYAEVRGYSMGWVNKQCEIYNIT